MPPRSAQALPRLREAGRALARSGGAGARDPRGTGGARRAPCSCELTTAARRHSGGDARRQDGRRRAVTASGGRTRARGGQEVELERVREWTTRQQEMSVDARREWRRGQFGHGDHARGGESYTWLDNF